MATLVIKPAVVERTCDMCGDKKTHFINVSGKTLYANRGYVQTQSDRWPKGVTFQIMANIPYQPSSDLCTDCAIESLQQIIRDIKEGE